MSARVQTEPDDLPTCWAVPLDEPPPTLPFPTPTAPEPAPAETDGIFLLFRGSDALPPLGFVPRLRRDNEAA